jgi:PRC-barrel domain
MRLPFITTALALGTVGLIGPSAGQDRPTAAQESNTSVVVLGSRQAESILGKEVRSKTDESMGRLIDVVVDRTGRPRAAVIDFGGFLGVGSRKIAIDWSALSFESDGRDRDIIVVDLTREQARAAPEYKDKRAVLVLGSSATSSTD